jgi:mono/diheme cytochrome c family protein
MIWRPPLDNRINLSGHSVLLRRMTPVVSLLVLAMMLGCRPPLPPSKPLADLTPQESQGHTVFQGHCAKCHYANTDDSFHGPGLQALYKQKYLPSGAPANDDRVTSVIQHGRGVMPAFGNKLDDQEISDLIAYLHTL